MIGWTFFAVTFVVATVIVRILIKKEKAFKALKYNCDRLDEESQELLRDAKFEISELKKRCEAKSACIIKSKK